MFTGIITDVGRVVARAPLGDGARFALACVYPAHDIAVGASIACAGACLTATTVAPEGNGSVFTVDASAETLDKTTLGEWQEGTPVNLERSLRAGDELGGHLVSGHVDGRAEIVAREDHVGMTVLRFAPPPHLLPFLAPKGSVCLDGTSLTVNEVGDTFTVALIPHTLAVTTWGARRVGDRVNIEVDTIARYVARLVAMRAGEG
jgi:riboflavin synthase